MDQIRGSKQLQFGALIFPRVDQIDFTGPFEIFSRLPGAAYHIIAKDKKAAYQSLTDARLATARRIRAKLGIEYNTVTAAD